MKGRVHRFGSYKPLEHGWQGTTTANSSKGAPISQNSTEALSLSLPLDEPHARRDASTPSLVLPVHDLLPLTKTLQFQSQSIACSDCSEAKAAGSLQGELQLQLQLAAVA